MRIAYAVCMKNVSIYYGCQELKYNATTDSWKSEIGLVAKKENGQISIYGLLRGNKIIGGISADKGANTAIFVSSDGKKSVHIFNQQGNDPSGKTLIYYLAQLQCKKAPESPSSGSFSVGVNSQSGITSMLDVAVGDTFGISGSLFYGYFFDPKGHYLSLVPLNLFANLPKRFSLAFGYLETISPSYGGEFPVFGGELALKFSTNLNDHKDYPAVAGKLAVRGGVSGGLDAGSEIYNTFDAIDTNDKIVCASLALKLFTSEHFQLGGEGVFSKYFDSSKTYDYLGGASVSLLVNNDPVRFSAAYYFLKRVGKEDHEVTSHKLFGKLDITVYKNGKFKFGVGGVGNYFLRNSSRKAVVSFEDYLGSMGALLAVTTNNNRNSNRSYGGAFISLAYDTFKAEIGGGVIKSESNADFHYSGSDLYSSSTSQEDSNKYFFLNTGYDW